MRFAVEFARIKARSGKVIEISLRLSRVAELLLQQRPICARDQILGINLERLIEIEQSLAIESLPQQKHGATMTALSVSRNQLDHGVHVGNRRIKLTAALIGQRAVK